jgi:sulfate adenylyltransferase
MASWARTAGSLLRKLMSEGKPISAEFSKPEAIAILKQYYDTLEEKVEVKLHGAATGELKQRGGGHGGNRLESPG